MIGLLLIVLLFTGFYIGWGVFALFVMGLWFCTIISVSLVLYILFKFVSYTYK